MSDSVRWNDAIREADAQIKDLKSQIIKLTRAKKIMRLLRDQEKPFPRTLAEVIKTFSPWAN
jgi:hypothetical protein